MERMEKLIELLSESTNGRFKSEQDLRLCIEMRGYCRDFIKWLVENDKIDDKKVPKSDYLAVQYDSLVESYKADELIMLLAISDTPIEDLVSYLK